MRTVDIQDSNNYLAGYYDEDNCQLLVCQDGEQTVLDRVGMMSSLEFWLWCLLVIAIVGAIEFGLWLFVRYLRRYASVTMKIVATVIPLALVCSMGFILVISALVDQNNRAQTNQSMESVARSVDAAGWIDGITDYHNTVEGLPLDDPQMLEFLLALQGINLTQNQNIQYTDTQQKVQTLTNHSMYSISFFGKDQTNGKYYCLFGDLMMNYYLEDISGFEEVQQVYRILESRQPQPITLYDILGQHLSCICYPVVQDNGQVTGFYLVEASQPESDSTLYLLLGWLALYEFVLSVAVVLLFSLIVFFSFKPMARLRRKAQILMGGNLPKADLVLKKNMDEISELSLTFQELSQQVGANMTRMTQLQQLSQAYFSQYILELFGKSSVAQLNFEESLTCPLYCASLRWDPGTLEFDQIHRRVRDLSGFLADCHGFFGSITGEEIHLLSRQKGLFQVAAFAAQEYPDFRVVFDYVPVTVQILGRYPEYRFGIVPEQENRYDLLCNYSDTLNCRLLASQTSFRSEDTSLFFRCVGVVDSQRLYEFFFDLQDSGYKISQTCLEQGVDYYVQGRWKQARNLFVQALQWEPEDRAAKYYIDLIDRQQNG